MSKPLFLRAVAAAAFALPLLAVAQATAPVGNPTAGAQKNQMCIGCHGITGWRTAFPEVYKVPKIGGCRDVGAAERRRQQDQTERPHPQGTHLAATEAGAPE